MSLPLRRAKSFFRIGKNSRGNWVVQDQSGLCGGLFVDRAKAVKFATLENGNRPQPVIMAPGVLELDMQSPPRNHWSRNDEGYWPRQLRSRNFSQAVVIFILRDDDPLSSDDKCHPHVNNVMPA